MRPTLRKSSMWAVLVIAATAFGFAAGHKSPGAAGGHPFEKKLKKQTMTAVGLSSSAALRTEQQLVVERLERWQKGLTAQSYAGATASQNDVVAELAHISERTLRINWDQTLGTPIFMSGKRLQSSAKFPSGFVSQQTAADRAMRFMRDNKQLLRLENPEDEFVMTRSEHDNLGMTHLRYQQVYRGLEVWGAAM